MNDLTKYIDNSVKQQDDFYQYTNGKWIESVEIPEEYPRWGTISILRKKLLDDVKSLLESDIEDTDFLKAKLFFNEGMNKKKRNELDLKPIKHVLDKINLISSKENLIETINYMNSIGENIFISFSSTIDRKNTEIEVPHISSSGLSLPSLSSPNKDYYFDDDKENIRLKYIDFLAKLFAFNESQEPLKNSEIVLEFEKKLAEKHYTQVQKRDLSLSYNKYNLIDLQKLSPNMDWNGYFFGLTDTNIDYLIVDNPEFIKLVDNMIISESLESWKCYLTARLLISNATYLSDKFETASFEFFGKTINGSKKLEDDWKRIINLINDRSILGELVGKYYVKKYFPSSSKEKMVYLVNELLASMKERIQELDWMSDETKKNALKKLSHFGVKIGYPDIWEDYSSLKISKNESFPDIVKKCILHLRNINLSRLYKAPNKDKWLLSPQTVNAYYHPFKNEIVFPASILQFPFFDEKLTWAENFGAIGTVIGHEITHGFDDKGSEFDANGNMNNWWTEEDKKKFYEKGQYFVDQYEEFLVNGKPINGKLTLGENIADHGGIKISIQALNNHYYKTKTNENDDLSSNEKFFYSFARIYRYKGRKEFEEVMRTSDPHSHPKARINITLANIKEFYDCFNVKEGDKLYRKDLPILW